ncbi:hypothetical protein JG687_00019044, partial [Phytophthora cactorum]
DVIQFDDDKQLVQLARAYEDARSIICWNDVAHSMWRTGHTPAALKQRLRSLMRTQGNRVSGFSVNFVPPPPPPLPPAIVRQLHSLRAVPRLPGRGPRTAPDRRTATISRRGRAAPSVTLSPATTLEIFSPRPLEATQSRVSPQEPRSQPQQCRLQNHCHLTHWR